jgi:hypothetical protein
MGLLETTYDGSSTFKMDSHFQKKTSLIPVYSIGPTLQDDGRSNQVARQIHPVS